MLSLSLRDHLHVALRLAPALGAWPSSCFTLDASTPHLRIPASTRNVPAYQPTLKTRVGARLGFLRANISLLLLSSSNLDLRLNLALVDWFAVKVMASAQNGLGHKSVREF